MAYKQLKRWFDKELAQMLADKILKVNTKFNAADFIKEIDTGVQNLELKGRVEFIADALRASLGNNYQKNTTILLQILGPENEEETGMFLNYYWVMPIAKYVEKYGLDDFEISMKAIEEITKRNTGEYAIRPFIRKYPKRTLTKIRQWSNHKNKHIRRLASEGIRPRLPWATKLQEFIDDPKPILPILNNLKDDPSKYVQKSVANCLNDILKDNLETGKIFVDSWIPGTGKARKWIIKHGLRNLIKQQNEWALKVTDQINNG